MTPTHRVREDYPAMLKECLTDDSDKLNLWEVEFLESVNRQQARGRPMTPRQETKVSEVWHRLF